MIEIWLVIYKCRRWWRTIKEVQHFWTTLAFRTVQQHPSYWAVQSRGKHSSTRKRNQASTSSFPSIPLTKVIFIVLVYLLCTTALHYSNTARRQHSRTGQWYTKKMLPFWVFLLLPLMMWYGWLVGYYTQPKYHSENTYRAPLSIYICGIDIKPLRMGALWMEYTHLSQSSIPLTI